MTLLPAQVDRAAGVLLGAACGDALGAGYEFGVASPPPVGQRPGMIGGGLGNFAPGEWTDDTAQTYAVAEVAARRFELRSVAALDEIARTLGAWYASGPADIGVLTRTVLRAAGADPTAQSLTSAANAEHERSGHTAGNGSLMRTSAVALAYLHDDADVLVQAAMAVSALTHADPRAGEACALWCLAIRHAVLEGTFDGVRPAVNELPAGSRDFWHARLDEAESKDPSAFAPNGFVVTALQAAWSAIVHTPERLHDPAAGSFGCGQVLDALEAAIRIGNDTDTVASIAGALLGARWGASAFPAEWRGMVHGWPHKRAGDLVDLALLTVNHGPDRIGWPGTDYIDYRHWRGHDSLAVHPHDDKVYLGGTSALDALPADVTAVVSLCRLGRTQVPHHVTHADFRLLDTTTADNPNLEFVIDDAARTVARLRDAGETVLLHCVAAQSRTPTVGARYAVLRGVEVETALSQVCAALPSAHPNAALVAALRALGNRS
jgi:ADP-ribosylglycohydrolase/protein-tyrosine phosphatase